MNEDILGAKVGLQTACDIWHNSEVQEAWLKDSPYSLKKSSSKLDDFLKKFRITCDKLAAIGKPLSDDDKVFQLARALGSRYSDFKTTMLTKPPYLSYKQFVNALLNHEQTVIVQQDEESSQSQSRRHGRQNTRGRRPSQNCGHRGNANYHNQKPHNNGHYGD